MTLLKRIPVITGLIKRRLLVNFRATPSVVQQMLPAPFRPKLQKGHAIAGICLIRLEQIRPSGFPAFIGFSSENAAHRIAVEWTDKAGVEREGVFIPRRDTDSTLNHLAGGRLFPGEHAPAQFLVEDLEDQDHLDPLDYQGLDYHNLFLDIHMVDIHMVDIHKDYIHTEDIHKDTLFLENEDNHYYYCFHYCY